MEIEKRVRDLIRKAGIKEAPVDVKKIARHLNIKVELSDLGAGCSGILVRNPHRKKAVIGRCA